MDPQSRSLLGAAIAIAMHGIVGAALASVDADAIWTRRPQIVELDVKDEPRPPPPEPRPEPRPTPEPSPEPRPRIAPRKIAMAEPMPPPAPPPPNQEPPANANAAPPVFGVTMSSTVSGDAAMAVPVGNTLMTKDRTRPKPTDAPPQPYAADGTRPFQPVAEVFISQMPIVLHEEKGDSYFPPEARKMGFEGKVKLRLGIDERGNVVEVRVIGKAGHGFDESATRAMWKFKFSPARTSDGRAVPSRIVYGYTFEQPR